MLIIGYCCGAASMLGWLVKHKGIAPPVPVWDRSVRKDGTFAAGDFARDAAANEYHCPGGQALRSQWRAFTSPRSHITKAGTILYHASQRDCQHCSLKAQCCPHTPTRKIARRIHEDARDGYPSHHGHAAVSGGLFATVAAS